MRKQGPCHHCGAKDTPLWRNGPQDKPVLCNACGSRWRIRGSLENYIPKRGHASRGRRSRKMRDVITDLDAEKNTRMARTEGAKREYKGAWMSFGGNPSQASDESGIWSASRSSLGLVTSDRQNVFDVAIKSGSDDHDEDTIDSEKRAGSWEANDGDGLLDPSDKFPHITMLHRELLKLYEQEKSSMKEEEVLIYDVVNPFMYENEIGYGSVLLKAPQPMEEAAASKDQSAPPPLDGKEGTPRPAVGSGDTMGRLQKPATALAPAGIPQFPDQETDEEESIAEIYFSGTPLASDGPDSYV